MQEDEHRAVEPIVERRRETAHPQTAVAEIDVFVRGGHRPLFGGPQAPVKMPSCPRGIALR